MSRGGDQTPATSTAAASRPIVRAHEGERWGSDMVHEVRRFQVLVVMVMVVMVMGQWHGGGRGAWHAVHGVVRGVRLEWVSLALRHRDVHGRQSFGAGQQSFIQTCEYVAL